MGDIIYDVTFENPPHVVGSPPVTGSGWDRPSTEDYVTISNGISGLPTQSAFVDSMGGFGGMSFFPSKGNTSGLIRVSWDMVMLYIEGPDDPQAYVNIPASSGAEYFAVKFYLAGIIQVDDAVNGATNVGTYALNDANAFEFNFDLDNDRYNMSIDGIPVLTGAQMELTRDLWYVSFTGGGLGNNAFAIDNFQWEVVPEPSAFVSMLLGVGLLGHTLWRSRRRNMNRA